MPKLKVSDVKNSKKFLLLYSASDPWILSFLDGSCRPGLSDDEISDIVDAIYDFTNATRRFSERTSVRDSDKQLHQLDNDTTRSAIKPRSLFKGIGALAADALGKAVKARLER